MAKNRPKQDTNRNELSEGKAIMLAVLVIIMGLIGGIYLIRLVIGFFFPGLIN